MRITTNAILRNYKSNLATSMANLDASRTKVMTGRQFTSAKEDPASALRAAVLERKYVRNQDYLDTVQDVQSFQDAQEDAAMQINTQARFLSKRYGLEALNGTNGSLSTRQTYADAWRGAQENMVLSLNATYEGKYVFAGADRQNTPFVLTTNADGSQTLTYRGIDVDAANGSADKASLDKLAKETLYVDMGFGLNIDSTNMEVDSTSAFNTSLPGISLVGYGKDANGTSQNMIILAGQIADCLEKEDFDIEEYKNLLSAFDAGRDNVLERVTTLGTQTEFLTTTKDRLETNEISLTTQLDNVTNVDMAEAITQFSWDQYVYNASLKVGTSILTPSFIDFMS